jgi:hypothetical protein
VATLCGGFRLVGRLLSYETDENLGELLDIGRVTTFVTDTKPPGVGAAHVSLPVCAGVHTHHFLEKRPGSWAATRSEPFAAHSAAKVLNPETDQDVTMAYKEKTHLIVCASWNMLVFSRDCSPTAWTSHRG